MCEVMDKYILEDKYESIAEMLKDEVPYSKIEKYLHVTVDDIKKVEVNLLSAAIEKE